MKKQYQYRLCLINTVQRDPEDAINSWGAKGWHMVNCWQHDDYRLRVVFEKQGKLKKVKAKETR